MIIGTQHSKHVDLRRITNEASRHVVKAKIVSSKGSSSHRVYIVWSQMAQLPYSTYRHHEFQQRCKFNSDNCLFMTCHSNTHGAKRYLDRELSSLWLRHSQPSNSQLVLNFLDEMSSLRSNSVNKSKSEQILTLIHLLQLQAFTANMI